MAVLRGLTRHSGLEKRRVGMAVPSVAVLRGQQWMSQTGADYRSLRSVIPLISTLCSIEIVQGLGVWPGANDQTRWDLVRVRPLSGGA